MLLEDKLRQMRPALGLPATTLRSRPADGDGLFGGSVCETSAGTCLLVERRYPLHHRHGRVSLAASYQLGAAAMAVLARLDRPPSGGLADAVFLDTETTGLSGGTGTYAFLVGLGFFEPDAFVIRQYFMRDYGEEPALLEAVADLLGRFSIVVTFNGKSFDAPLLETRYTLARHRPAITDHLHVDLLPPARRLWRHRLESCRLAQVETVFGHQRTGDVPAWTIPSRFFNFVRWGDAAPLQPVFQHNRVDVLSLAALAAYMGRLLDDPCAEEWAAEEAYGAARLLEDRRLYERAAVAFERAWALAPDQAIGRAAAARLAALHKRLGRPDLAVPLWQRLATSPSPLALHGYVELAKYYEHRARDRTEAIRQTQRAQDLVSLLELTQRGDTTLAAERQALEHRLARLLRAQRAASGSPTPRATRPPRRHPSPR